MSPRLVELAGEEETAVIRQTIARDTEIVGLTCDSRAVRPGFLFAALPGTRADGRAYIADALARGAAAVVAPKGTEMPGGERPAVPMLAVENPRRLYALMAARFYRSQPETVVAVTGTNGKTSTVRFLAQIWNRLGRKAASAGTLGISGPGIEIGGSLTTPDPVELHRNLKTLADAGTERLAIEASSHGLAQYRLDGVRLAAGAFANLTRDHLDYHGSAAAYLAAKLRLFEELLPVGASAVVNADGAHADAVIAVCRRRGLAFLTCGRAGTDVTLKALAPEADGQRLALRVMGHACAITLPLVGAFQAENALLALGLAIACGEDPAAATECLAHLQGVPGRLEQVGAHGDGAAVYVDYAHTPDALENVLTALRPHAGGKLAVVFGCGGDRDSGKRSEMGAVARRLADRITVTDDNPRSEDPAAIRRAVMAGCPGAREIGDRAGAIRDAIAALGPGDVLVIAGKGHEQGQIVGAETRPFDDREEARRALRELAP